MATAARRSCIRFGEFALDYADERLSGPHGPVRIGNKAFRVLSALAENEGRLLTKEDLFQSAWDGITVSESALTSVVKELRRALGDDPRAPRYIESVYGRGYRFLAPVLDALPLNTSPPVDRAAPGHPIAPALSAVDTPGAPARGGHERWSRRQLLVSSGAAAAAIAGAALAIHLARGPKLSPEVERLVGQARLMMDQNSREAQNQAIGLLRRVVAMAPDYADGWGQLGMAYAVPSHYRDRPEALTLRARAEAAAKRSLELDSDNVYGELALGIAVPFVGAYAERDRHFARAMATAPDNDDVLTLNAVQLQFVGRAAASLPLYKRIAKVPLTPAAYHNYIAALWSAGRWEELDRALEDAAALYPTQANLWFDRFNTALFGGRAAAAVAMVRDSSGWPTVFSERDVEALLAHTPARSNPGSADADKLAAAQIDAARRSASAAELAILLLAQLGRVDQAFAIADAYYFNRGFAVPDYTTPGSRASPDQRQTRLLFEPRTRAMRADARFEPLVARLGLDRYWRDAGLVPDYRQGRA
jgi:DNA-binding winged helix-turn-helix (wHTH) protein